MTGSRGMLAFLLALAAPPDAGSPRRSIVGAMFDKAAVVAHVRVLSRHGPWPVGDAVEGYAATCEVVEPLKGDYVEGARMTILFDRWLAPVPEAIVIENEEEYVIFAAAAAPGQPMVHRLVDRWVGVPRHHDKLVRHLKHQHVAEAAPREPIIGLMRQAAESVVRMHVVSGSGGLRTKVGQEQYRFDCEVIEPFKGPKEKGDRFNIFFIRHTLPQRERLPVEKDREYVALLGPPIKELLGWSVVPNKELLQVPIHGICDHWVGVIPYHPRLEGELTGRRRAGGEPGQN